MKLQLKSLYLPFLLTLFLMGLSSIFINQLHWIKPFRGYQFLHPLFLLVSIAAHFIFVYAGQKEEKDKAFMIMVMQGVKLLLFLGIVLLYFILLNGLTKGFIYLFFSAYILYSLADVLYFLKNN